MGKKHFAFFLLSFLAFLFFSCKQPKGCQAQTIVWEKNQLTVKLSSEQIQVGELLLIYFEGKLHPHYSFKIVHTKEIPLETQFLHFSFQDIEERKAVGELLWLEAGEKKITDLAVEFYCADGRKATFQLDPLVVEVYSTLQPNEKKSPQSFISLFTHFPDLKPPLSFSSWDPKKAGIGLFVSALFSFSAIFATAFFLNKNNKIKKNKNRYIEQYEIIFNRLKEDSTSKDNLLEIYNLLLQGKKELKLKKIRINSQFYHSMIFFLENSLFSNSQTIDDDAFHHFLSQLENWISQLKKIESDTFYPQKESL